MNFLMKLFDLRGLKLWALALVVVLNLVLMGLFFVGVNMILSQRGGWSDGTDIAMMISALSRNTPSIMAIADPIRA